MMSKPKRFSGHLISCRIFWVIIFLLGVGCGAKPTTQNEKGTAAHTAFNSGRYDSAARLFEELAKDQNKASLWRQAARSWLAAKRFKDAEKALVRACILGDRSSEISLLLEQAFPKSARRLHRYRAEIGGGLVGSPADYWSQRGRQRFERGAFIAAAKDLEIAVLIDPLRISDWMSLGNARRDARDSEGAAKAYAEAFFRLKKHSTKDSDGRRRRRAMFGSAIRFALLAKNHELAADVVLDLIEGWPISLMVRFLKNSMLPGLKPAEPIIFRKLLIVHPKSDYLRAEYALILHNLGRWDETLTVVESISPMSIHAHDAYQMAVTAAFKLGMEERALRLLGQQREALPNSRLKFIQLIRGLLRAKRFGRARSETFVALHRRPQDADLKYLYAISIQEIEGGDRAIPVMTEVLQLDGNHAEALNFIGYHWADTNQRLSKAEEYIRKALKISPGHPAYQDSLGWVFYRQGKFKKAVIMLRRALKGLPEQPEMLFHLACVLKRVGKGEESDSHYRRALRLETDVARRRKYEAEWNIIKKL